MVTKIGQIRMIKLKWILVLLCLWSSPTFARDLLPVALEHQSIAFALDGRKAPLPIGARVEFVFKNDKGIPKKMPYVSGFVLGTLDDVVFFELSNRNAAALAKRVTTSEVSYQKIKDPVAEEIKVRRQYRDSGHAIRLAPQMRRLTLTVNVDANTVDTWTPGEVLTFFGAQERRRQKKINGEWKSYLTYRDVTAMFRSATKTASGQYDVTVVAGPHDADHLLRAEVQNRLTVDPETAPNTEELLADSRCYVVRRAGNERMSVQIPCRN